jgi:hypothetical protein
MKRIGLTALWTFGLFGFLGAIVHGVRWWKDTHPPDDANVVAVTKSQDGHYSAVIFMHAGGGALAPFCIEYVSVVDSGILPKDAWERNKSVFTSSCNAQMSLRWITDRQLEITFNPTLAAEGVDTARLRRYADSGHVEITYRFWTK